MTSFKLDDARPCMTQRDGTGVSRMKQIYASRLKRRKEERQREAKERKRREAKERQRRFEQHQEHETQSEKKEEEQSLGVAGIAKLIDLDRFPHKGKYIDIKKVKGYIKGYFSFAARPGHEAYSIKSEHAVAMVTMLTPDTQQPDDAGQPDDANLVGSLISYCDGFEGLRATLAELRKHGRRDPFADQKPRGPGLYGKIFVPVYDLHTHEVLGKYCLYYKDQ